MGPPRSGARTERQWQEWLEDLVRRGDRLAVADDAGQVVGFASYGANRDQDNGFDAELYAIYVDPDRLGRGIGTALVRDMGRWLEAHGYEDVVVWCLKANPWCRFYGRSGARPVAQRIIEIGSRKLEEIGYGWHTMATLREE